MSEVDPTEPPSEVVAPTLADGVAGRARAAPAAGGRIGHFEVRKKLGEGGMGVVFEAYDAQLDRPVAIKLVRAGEGGAQAHARLLREAQAMAKVSHPNVVPIYEVGEHGDQVFVAMELVDGEPLSAWQRREQRNWRDTLAVYIAAGRGLSAAHACGIIHRDFKPDNVLVGRDGRPRVLDFGLARSIADRDETAPRSGSVLGVDLTIVGSIMGTPTYMSPEHFRGEGIGPASDQFGFAVALYRALFGEAPFWGETMSELRDSVCGGRLRTPMRGEVPIAVVDAVMRALSLAPGDRFASMDELLAELDKPLHVDPSKDLRRGRGTRRLAAGLLCAGALASAIATSAASELDKSPGWVLVQSCIVMGVLSVLGLVFRRRIVTSAHNRRLALAILVTGFGFVVHRAVAYMLGAPTLDTFIGDAVMLGVVTVLAGVALERWMIWGGPLAVVYLAIAVAAPSLAGPAFSALVLVYAAGAAWHWGR
jgi:eukaryotic-like serine/threonine-protein kinase